MSNYVIVGSFAWAGIDKRISYKDIDVWYYGKKPKLITLSTSYDFQKMPKNIVKWLLKHDTTLNVLYTIKCSHLGWSNPMWTKHKQQLLLMQKQNAKIIPELYNLLINHWKIKLGDKAFLSLDKNKKEFFTDHVNYRFNHDDLHIEASYYTRPLYELVLKKGSEVLICEKKFKNLLFTDQIRLFKEEIHTIALERWILNPYWIKKGISINVAHSLSIQKTITNLTKNWACDFIIQNLNHFVKPDYKIYYKVINKLLTNKEKEIYMPNETALDYLQTVFQELCLVYPQIKPDGLDCFIYELCEDDIYNDDKIKLLEYEHLQQEGGGEGGAEDCYGVFKIKDKTFKAYYQYRSHEGHDYSDIEYSVRFVTPKLKQVTVYE